MSMNVSAMKNNSVLSEEENVSSFNGMLQAQAKKTPSAIAFITSDGRQCTFGEWDTLSSVFAQQLRSMGVLPQDMVAILTEQSPEYFVGMLAIMKVGGVFIPLNSEAPVERSAAIIRDHNVRVLVCTQSNSNALGYLKLEGLQTAVVNRKGPYDKILEMDFVPHNNKPEDPCYIICTSGSTGKPKGVVVPHRGICNMIRCMNELIPMEVGDIGFIPFVLHFDGSLLLFMTLSRGATLYLLAPTHWMNMKLVIQDIIKYNINCIVSLPTWTNLVFSNLDAGTTLPAMKWVICGGDLVSDALLHRIATGAPNAQCINMYGPTEATVFCMAHVCDPKTAKGPLPIGKPISGTYIYLLDESLQQVPVGEAGEIYVGGAQVALGYYNNEAQTKASFIADPFNPELRVYRTGDFGRVRSDGNVEFMSRKDGQIKISGYRVEVGEVHHVISSHPNIQDAYVVPVNTSPNSERPVYKLQAFVVPKLDTELVNTSLTSELVDYLTPKLPHYMIPEISPVSEFTYTANGKVDFKKMLADLEEETRKNLNASDRQATLLQIATQVLGHEVSPTDNLLETGLNSILATQFVWLASQARISLSVTTLFSFPTISSLVAELEQSEHKEESEEVEVVSGERIPLTYAESSLYFLQTLDKTSFAYNESFLLRMQGELDDSTLQTALSTMAERQPNLRARFFMDSKSGIPYKQLTPKLSVAIQFHETSSCDDADLERQAQRLVETQGSKAFDLESGHLIRLFVLNDNTSSKLIMGITMHHIVCDGWSVALFSYELSKIYETLSKLGNTLAIDTVVSHAKLSPVQHVVPKLSATTLEQNTKFWKAELEDNVPFLELPMDFARPKTRTESGASHCFTLSHELYTSLKAYCQQNNVTLFVALLSAYTAFLYRYSGSQKQFSVGIPAANRTPNIKHLIGYFVNVLVMNMKMENVSYSELTKRVQAQVLRCMAHKDMPIQKLIEATNAPRVGNYSPFFQNMFVMHQPVEDYVQTAFGDKLPAGWEVKLPHLDMKTAKFDLILTMMEETDRIEAEFRFSTELFKPATIERMTEGFMAMLQGIVAAPSVHIATLPCLSAADKAMLYKFNAPMPKPLVPFNFSLHEMFHSVAEKTPQATAFVKPSGRKFTYHEWDVYSSLFAIKLREAGIKPRQLVAILTNWSFEYFVGLFGILKAGGAWLPIDPQAPADRTNITLRDNQIEMMVHLSHQSTDQIELQGAKKMVMVPKVEKNASNLQAPAGFEMYKSAPEDPCYVICTSGSTGTPKAVLIPHRAIVNLVTWMTRQFPMEPSDVGMFPFALHFDASNSVFMMFAAGAALYLHRPADQLNMDYMAKEFVKHNITVCHSLPTWMNLLYTSLKSNKLPHVKHLGCGGDMIPQALPERILEASPKAQFCNFYGPTETTIISLCYQYDPKKADGGSLPIGTPILNYATFLLDENLQQVPVGAVGEICVGGPGVALGYHNNEAMTQKAFVESTLLPGSKLYRTGDYGRMRPDGQVEFLSRRDGQVKIFGYRIETGEIQNVLCQSECVQDALVVPVKIPSDDGKTTYELRAFIVVTDAHVNELPSAVRKLVQKYLQSKLPPYMIPKLNIIPEFPYSQNGKVDVRALLAIKEEIEPNEEKAVPQAPEVVGDDVQKQIANVFEEALGVSDIGSKSIFELGGNSITAVAIVNKINALLGKQLPVISIFESGGTINGLTEKVAVKKELTSQEIFVNKLVALSNQWGHQIRVKLFNHMKNNEAVFGFLENQTMEQQRDKAWERLMNLIQHKFLFYPTRETLPEYEAILESIAMYDFQVAMLWRNQFMAVVQCLQYSGSSVHADLVQQLANFQTTGAVALSELGHGSNTSQIETVATYDPESDCFVLNTPNDMAQKYWCGGAAKFAKNLIVVAKLIVGNENHGLHLFVFPLRDTNGKVMPGITVVDCGQKMGLNGLDNGRVWLHNLKVPRVGGMLDRFAQVTENGEYTTVIPNMHVRNAAHLAEPILIEGRLSISGAAMSIIKTALAIAVRYAASRKQFGPKNLPIIEAFAVQQRLFPHVARTWVINTLTKFMTRVNIHPSADPLTGYTQDHIAQLSSAVKPYCCWTTLEILRDCREVCGGQGFRTANRIGGFITDAEGLCTAEGAGDLLVPLFAKSMLAEVSRFTSNQGPLTARFKPLEKLFNSAEKEKIVQQLLEADTRLSLIGIDFQLNALLLREFELLNKVSQFYADNDHLDQFDADNMIFDELKQLSFAHLERVAFEQLLVVERMESAEIVPLLEIVRSAFVLDRLQNCVSSYHTLPFTNTQKTLIKSTVRDICGAMKDKAVDLVNGFGVPEFLLGEIGNDWLAYNAEPAVSAL